jgi:hypothetical protein
MTDTRRIVIELEVGKPGFTVRAGGIFPKDDLRGEAYKAANRAEVETLLPGLFAAIDEQEAAFARQIKALTAIVEDEDLPSEIRSMARSHLKTLQ